MLLKAHLPSHSRMSHSRWVTTPSWLSGSWRSFLYSSSVYSCHLFLISSPSVRSLLFPSFIVPIFAWNVPLVSLIFLKRSLVFSVLLFFFLFLHWSLRKAFLSLLFLKRSLAFPFYCFLLFLCIDHWGKLSYLSLLFFETLHSNGYIFPPLGGIGQPTLKKWAAMLHFLRAEYLCKILRILVHKRFLSSPFINLFSHFLYQYGFMIFILCYTLSYNLILFSLFCFIMMYF